MLMLKPGHLSKIAQALDHNTVPAYKVIDTTIYIAFAILGLL